MFTSYFPNHYILYVSTFSIMNHPKTLKLPKGCIEKILITDIIYAEIAEGGAMGNDGGLMFYLIENEQLICYEANLFSNEDVYLEASELLLKHQNSLNNDEIKNLEIIFDYYYGGFGNHVFINKNITLIKKDDYFIYQSGKNNYPISCSVKGVFNAIAYAIENSKGNIQ